MLASLAIKKTMLNISPGAQGPRAERILQNAQESSRYYFGSLLKPSDWIDNSDSDALPQHPVKKSMNKKSITCINLNKRDLSKIC